MGKPIPELPADSAASGNLEERKVDPKHERPDKPLKSQDDFADERDLGAPKKRRSKWDQNGWPPRGISGVLALRGPFIFWLNSAA